MPTFTVRVSVVPHETPGAAPPARPTETAALEVEADNLDKARSAAQSSLVAKGYRVRSLSYLVDGGLSAVVYAPA